VRQIVSWLTISREEREDVRQIVSWLTISREERKDERPRGEVQPAFPKLGRERGALGDGVLPVAPVEGDDPQRG
jgi:hypothetical protein